jgi:hypothetical protein
VEAINSDDIDRQYDATIKFRKMLSKEQNPPIQQVIDVGMVPKFVEFLDSRHGILQVKSVSMATLLGKAF